jgi:Methionine biosynthesis protein MetW
VAALLANGKGTVLDVGARDSILRSHLNLAQCRYLSADVSAGSDYCIDLERPLAMADSSFDYVVALDVLEHVEHIHQAFHELARLARKQLIVALPNFATLTRRWSFLKSASLRTKKFDLLPDHQGDRHRWLTTYSQINNFVGVNAPRAGLALEQVIEEIEGGTVWGRGIRRASEIGLFPAGLQTARCIYVMTRPHCEGPKLGK